MADKQVYLEDFEVGMEIPKQEYGPWSNAHITRWCAAQENWERFHYDYKFATEQFGLEDIVANGNWRKHPLARAFKDWAGEGGWLWKIQMQYRGMHYPFDVFNVWGRVREMKEVDGIGIVDLDCGMTNQHGQETSPGSAIVAVPLKNGKDVPYPFVPPPSLQGPEYDHEPGHNLENAKYVNAEVRSHIGYETEGEAWDEISKPELRRFSQAIPDPDPLYWDEEYAKGTRFGSIMAMPLYPVDGFKHPPTEPDQLTLRLKEDPNYWGGPPGRMSGEHEDHIPGLPTGGALNGGQSYEVLGLARLGEKLSRKSRLLDVYERQGSKNRLVFTVSGTTYFNSKGEVLLKGKGVGIMRG
jgi:acyl dehydratase